MKREEALRSLDLSASYAGRHGGAVTGEARSISSGHLGSVPKATEPGVEASKAGLAFKGKIGV